MNSELLDARVQQLVDAEEIRRLIYDYAFTST